MEIVWIILAAGAGAVCALGLSRVCFGARRKREATTPENAGPGEVSLPTHAE